jgi:hypothetical protein
MKKLLCAVAVAALVAGCCGEGPATSKHSGKKYYPVKVCSIGDVTGESCVEYAAENYCNCDNKFRITTLDGHKYEFNEAGWSIIITKK